VKWRNGEFVKWIHCCTEDGDRGFLPSFNELLPDYTVLIHGGTESKERYCSVESQWTGMCCRCTECIRLRNALGSTNICLTALSKSKLLYDWRSASHYVLVSSTFVGLATRYVRMLLSEICGLVSVGRPLWRENGFAICNVITQWSKSRRTRNHTLLSHLRLSQPGEPGSCVLIRPKAKDI
jgi:hypothetical protein